MEMKFRRIKWLTALAVITFMLAFEYVRHFVWMGLLHTWIWYILSVATVLMATLLFNQIVFGLLDKLQKNLLLQNRRLSTLNAIAVTVNQSLKLEEILSEALDKTLAALEVEAGGIYLMDADGKTLVLQIHRGISAEFKEAIQRIGLDEGVSGQAIAMRKPVVLETAAYPTTQMTPAVLGESLQTLASTPLVSKGQILGTLTLGTRRQRAFPSQDLELLAAIGHQIGMAIEGSRLYIELQQQVSYLNVLIESSGNAIITSDLKGKILSWNRGAEIIYGWSKAEAIDQNIPMVPDPLKAEAHGWISQLIEAGEPLYNIETQRLRKDGEQIPVMVTVSPIKGADSKFVCLLGISTDMRDKKQLEQEVLQQQQALTIMEERERLARELHDNLGQILGYVNTQAQAACEMLAKNQVTVADTYLRRLVEVVQDAHEDVREDILSLQTNPLKEVGLLPALEKYLWRFSQHNSIKTELVVADKWADIAFGSNIKIHLMRIIQEAITNTRKHAGAQHVWITFEVANDQAQITIKDDGCGFHSDQMFANTFGHFGLRIMQDRAKEIGASLQVQSNPGQGTTVKIQTPLG